MNAKIALLLLLGFSFLVMGCGKQAEPTTPAEIGPTVPPAEEGEEPATEPEEEEEVIVVEEEEEAPPEEEPEAEEEEESEAGEEEETAGEDIDEETLAGLFEVETDKPLEDEGLQEDGTPSAQE